MLGARGAACRSGSWPPWARRCWARWSRSRWCGTGSVGRSSTNLLIFLPMATPEIVMGSSLLALFIGAGLRGAARLLDDPDRAHHVLPVVRGRHRARPGWRAWTTTSSRPRWTSTPTSGRRSGGSPSRWSSPGILAAALLSFSLSFDDFIVTNLNPATRSPSRCSCGGRAQRGIPPQVNVIGTVMFLVALALVARRQPAPAPPSGLTWARARCGRAVAGRRGAVGLLARRPARAPRGWPRCRGPESADLVVVGGGYTGLWAALRGQGAGPADRRGAARGGALR